MTQHDPFFLDDAKKIARRNTWFRQVVYTGPHSQLVLMSVPPGGEIGEEVHEAIDQVFVVVEGDADAFIAGKRRAAHKNDLLFVRGGVRHNIRNTGHEDLKLLTVYSPPAHAEGTIHRTREDAIGAMVTRHTAPL
jgi:mannose-6-phosphate isomerase-like protein (cupin superfamily)